MSMSVERIAAAVETAVRAQKDIAPGTLIDLACDCGEFVTLPVGAPDGESIRAIVALVSHVAFAHVTTRDVILRRSTPIIPAPQLREMLGLA